MKLLLVTILVLLSYVPADACSCRDIADQYSFFKNAKNVFVGQVVSQSENSDFLIFEFKIIDKLRGDFKNTEFVYSSKKGMCQLQATRGQVYLIEVNKIQGKFRAGFCSFKEDQSSRTFREDTFLIKLFGGRSFQINSTYFKGTVENGKRTGIWTFYNNNDTTDISSTGEFKDDKKDGIWTSKGDASYFEKGQFIKRISVVPVNGKDFRKITYKQESILFYPNGQIYKKRTQSKYMVFYPDGILKESVSINKNGYFYKTWKKYDKDGKLVESVELKNDNEISADKFCCYDD